MEQADEKRKPKKTRGFFWRVFLGLGSTFIMFGVLAGAVVALLSGQTLQAPDWVAERLESSLNSEIAPATVSIGSVELTFQSDSAPSVSIRDVEVFDAQSQNLAIVPKARFAIDRARILDGQFKLEAIQIDGLSISLTRLIDGELDVALGQDNATPAVGGSPAEIVDSLNGLFAAPGLEALQSIVATNVSLSVTDQKAGRFWDVTDGSMAVTRQDQGAEARLSFVTQSSKSERALVEFNVFANDEGLGAQLGMRIEDIATVELGDWGPALEWLKLMDAPASGAMRVEIDDVGKLADVNVALDIGVGQIALPGFESPVSLQEGRVYFRFNPETGIVFLDDLRIDSEILSFSSDGQLLQTEGDSGPEVIAQVGFANLVVGTEPIAFENALQFETASADIRVTFDPVRIDIGQVSLFEGESEIRLKGQIKPDPSGLTLNLDLQAFALKTEDLLKLWPLDEGPLTRTWLAENLIAGLFDDASIAVRIAPERPPVFDVGFTFSEVSLSYLPEQPPLVDLQGYGSISSSRLTVVADRGFVRPTPSTSLNASGTVFVIEDIDAEPNIVDLTLNVSGPIEGQLDMLDREPFEFLKRSGQSAKLATGMASTQGKVVFPLVDIIPDEQIKYSIRAQATEVFSDVIVEGYTIASEALQISADRLDGLRIGGIATFGGVPIEGEWVLPLDENSNGSSRLTGAIEVSQFASDSLGLGLPDGTFSGKGLGRIEVDFPPDQTPKLRFFSDLNQVGVSAPAIGWFKSQDRTGSLEVLADLSDPPSVTKLTLQAPGLEAEGNISLSSSGDLDRAEFQNVQVGGWFNGPVALVGRGPDRPFDVAVTGGRMDLRSSNVGTSSGNDAGDLDVRLDRLVISESISLTNLIGDFDPQRGMSGRFTGRVNGRSPITGELFPSKHGTAVKIWGKDGGAILRDVGLLETGHGGAMELTLQPRSKEGFYDGFLKIDKIRVRDAPAMADLLNAISVVGLLEQLNGDGILFAEVDGKFILTPDEVLVQNSRAVGASLGLTMDGTYDLNGDVLDMQGVVTPVYAINGIGSLISRPGEGVIGISYKMGGSSDDPNVSVNPLSLLTPGFLRDIFRKPSPKIEE